MAARVGLQSIRCHAFVLGSACGARGTRCASVSAQGYLGVQKVRPFLMFETPLPPLPPSPASTISHLDLQFNSLAMSSENPDEAPQVQLAASPDAVAPLTLEARLELIAHLRKFTEDAPKSEDPGFLDHHCQTLDAAVDVRNRILMNLFCTNLVLLDLVRSESAQA